MITARTQTVTPELAQHWLENMIKNRNVNLSTVASYARAMTDGAWQANGQAVIFDDLGTLVDGQHRLRAVIQSGACVPMLVVRGVENGATQTIDMGRARRVGDVLTMQGHKRGRNAAALARLIAWFESGRDAPFQVPPHIQIQIVEAMGDDIERAMALIGDRIYPGTPSGGAAVMAPIAFCRVIDPAVVDEFAGLLKQPESISDNHPAEALRRAIAHSQKKGGMQFTIDIAQKTTRAIELYLAGKTTGQLLASPEAVRRMRKAATAARGGSVSGYGAEETNE